MKFYQLLALTFLAVGCGKSSDAPLHGTVKGTSFTVTGVRSTRIDSYVVLTLLNAPATCATPETQNDGLIRVDVSVPKAMLAPGTYPIGTDVKVGVTKLSGATGMQKFDGVSLAEGTVNLSRVGDQVEGSLSGSANDVSLSGTFTVPLCP